MQHHRQHDNRKQHQRCLAFSDPADILAQLPLLGAGWAEARPLLFPPLKERMQKQHCKTALFPHSPDQRLAAAKRSLAY